MSALALVHQRFSTNTFPTWDLAHPFRLIAHNGEINTLRGNVNWIRARQGAISSPMLGDDLDKVWPLIYDGQSDSASFDNALELLVMGGYSVAHAMMMMIPEAWAEPSRCMDASRRAFYEYHAAMMEPWDGPASIAFTDGRQIGATLDRNGLRPARYIVTDDDLVIMGSECGVPADSRGEDRQEVAPAAGQDVPRRPREGPHRRRQGAEGHARRPRKPYAEWIDRIRIKLDDLPSADEQRPSARTSRCSTASRRSATRRKTSSSSWRRWAQNGEEPIGSMGNDSPLRGALEQEQDALPLLQAAVRAGHQPADRPDPRRARDVLVSFIGPKPNLLGIDEMNPPLRLEVTQPVLDFDEMEKIRHIERYTDGKFRSFELDITLSGARGASEGDRSARSRASRAQAEDAVRAGYIDPHHLRPPASHRDQLAIPGAARAVGDPPAPREQGPAHVDRPGGRDRLGARGAPLRAARRLRRRGDPSVPRARDAAATSPTRKLGAGRRRQEGVQELRQGDRQGPEESDVQDGHLDLHVVHRRADLRGGRPVAARSSTSTSPARRRTSRASACSKSPRKRSACTARRSAATRCSRDALDAGGEYAWRVRGEEHMWTPDAIAKLQHAARANSYATYKEYAQLINDQSRAAHDVPRPVRVQARRSARRCRSRKSSRRRRSSSASPPARCRSARSRPRRTRRSPSR